MTPQEFTDLVNNLRVMTQSVKSKAQLLDALIERVQILIDRDDPLTLPLSQAEVDHMINLYSPMYIAALQAVEVATDALGSDILN